MVKRMMMWSLCSMIAAACLYFPVNAGAQANVSMWAPTGTGGESELHIDLVEQFNKAHSDIVVELIHLPSGSYSDQVNAAALSGQLPCVLDFDGPYVYNFVWSGYLIPLDDYISPEMKADFLPSIIKQGTYNDQLYTIGYYESGLGIWANKVYLEKAGVRIPTGVEDAWAREEFDDALAKLKALPEIEYPLDLKINYGVGEWYPYGLAPILQSFGGDLIDRSDYQSAEGVLNGPEAVEAMTWFQNLFTQGYVNPEPAGDDSFYGAKTAALSLVGNWMWVPHKESLGDDLLLLPMPKFGPRHVTGMGTWNWAITSSCPNPDAAWEFMEFLHSPESILKVTEVMGSVPSRNSAAAQSDLYKEGGPLHLYIQQLNTIALERPVTPAYPTISRAFAEAVDNIIAGEDVKTQLDKAVQRIDQDIQENGGYPVLP